MNATGEGLDVANCAKYAVDRITAELAADEPQLKKLYEMRQADEKQKALWEKAKLGRDRALEIQRRLGQIKTQALAMNMLQVTLSPEECALFAYGESA